MLLKDNDNDVAQYWTKLAIGDKMQILDFGDTHLDSGSLGQ